MDRVWNEGDPVDDAARGQLELAVAWAEIDLPFAARIGQFALESTTVGELERLLTSMLVVVREARHPFLPDVVAGIIAWLDRRRVELDRDQVLRRRNSSTRPAA